LRRLLGVAMLSLGILLLAAAGAYFGYRSYARANSDALNVSAGVVAVQPSGREQAGLKQSQGDALFAAYQAAYTGVQVHPKYWAEPLWAGARPLGNGGLPEGFVPVSVDMQLMASGLAARAERIAIPAIGVESDVAELAILDLGNSRQYETPKNVVGHIPETANPGEPGNGWFFGHLESPIRGEGSVFRRLPEVPGLLEEYLETGDGPVYVFLSSLDGEFLYQVTETKVVHRDELALYDSDGAAITLVTCYPRFAYDQRVVVTAKLVGVKG
jgi:LPXTG-site transpeptidase (sortase) family protein